MKESNPIQPASYGARTAKALSIALVPPTFGIAALTILALSVQHGPAYHTVMVWLAATAGSGLGQIGYLIYLLKERKVSAYDVPEHLQRTKPYLLSAGMSFISFLLLLYLDASIFITALLWCYTVNTLILVLINRWWKISAHMMGMAGPLTGLYPLFGPWLVLLLPLAALLGWSRIRLGAHSFAQVVAGAFLGLLLTAPQLFLIFSYDLL